MFATLHLQVCSFFVLLSKVINKKKSSNNVASVHSHLHMRIL